MDQRFHVLGEARSAIARAGVDERVADARVGADAASYVVDVDAEPITQVGDFVDEADLGREQRVGRVLGELGFASAHRQHTVAVHVEWAIQLQHDLLGCRRIGADDDAARAHEVVDGRAFLQEFRIADDIEERSVDAACCDRLLDPVAGADRHGRLGRNDGVLIDHGADVARHLQHAADVGRTVVVRRRADGDHHDRGTERAIGLAALIRVPQRRAEAQSARRDAALHQRRQSRLVKRHFSGGQPFDPSCVDVDAEHRMTDLAQARAGHQADIPRSSNDDRHAPLLKSPEDKGCGAPASLGLSSSRHDYAALLAAFAAWPRPGRSISARCGKSRSHCG